MIINIQDDILILHNHGLLKRLLEDKTTKKNIMWATDAYSTFGERYFRNEEIKPELITGANSDIIKTRARKAMEQQFERTRQRAEVFTPLWVCTGAITGNILGALLGHDAIDEKWKKDLELHDVIIEMADDICHGCQISEYSHYDDPDWFRKYIAMRWKDESSDNVQEDMTLGEFVQSPGFYEMNKALRDGGVF